MYIRIWGRNWRTLEMFKKVLEADSTSFQEEKCLKVYYLTEK